MFLVRVSKGTSATNIVLECCMAVCSVDFLVSGRLCSCIILYAVPPRNAQRSWLPSLHLWSGQMRALSHLHSNYTDVTGTLAQFRADIETGRLGLGRRQNDGNPFPCVRCPQGCYMFVDDLDRGKLELSSAVYYLVNIGTNLTSFNADSSKLKGARSDWDVPVRELD